MPKPVVKYTNNVDTPLLIELYGWYAKNMDTTQYPDITTMTLEEAKGYILQNISFRVDSHHVVIDGLASVLLDAAAKRREASDFLKGSRMQTFYGSPGNHPDAKFTAVLYDAAWALVADGILRPGPIYYGVLNQTPSGFSLTQKGKEKFAKAG